MNSLLLHNSDVAIARLKAAQISANGWLQPGNATPIAGYSLADLYAKTQCNLPFVINCSGITTVDGHFLDGFRPILESGKIPVLFTHLREHLASILHRSELKSIGLQGVKFELLPHGNDDFAVTVNLQNPTTDLVEKYVSFAHKLERSNLHELVLRAWEHFPDNERRPLSSTPLSAPGVFNARRLISDPDPFLAITLQLGDILQQILAKEPSANTCLLGATLRGCPFAASLAFSLQTPIPFEIVDHIGPKVAILEEHNLSHPRTGLDYIYVGDFVVGGTELKVAANWAAHRGSRMRHALVVGSWLDPKAYQLPNTKIRPLVNLQALKPDIEYKFGAI